MKLLCKLFGHKWADALDMYGGYFHDGCKCKRCNETRDVDHHFSSDVRICGSCGKINPDYKPPSFVCAICENELSLPKLFEKEIQCPHCGTVYQKLPPYDHLVYKLKKINIPNEHRGSYQYTGEICVLCGRCNYYIWGNPMEKILSQNWCTYWNQPHVQNLDIQKKYHGD